MSLSIDADQARISKRFWHALPLHYAPHLLLTGRLYSQNRIAELSLPIRPRRTAARRDRALGLAGYVHLSTVPITPLLIDKLRRGWPHVLVEFDASVTALPGAAGIRYNHKAWRHRDDFKPVTDPSERADLLSGRYPSVELVIPDELPLTSYAVAIHAPDGGSAAWLGGLVLLTGLPGGLPIRISPQNFPLAPPPADLTAHVAYAEACREAGRLLNPPILPFD